MSVVSVLSAEAKAQVSSLVPLLTRDVVFEASLGDDERSAKLRVLLDEVAALSDRITVAEASDPRTPSFAITSPGVDVHIRFAGIPLGHEFASFMLALVQVGGHRPKVDDSLREAIAALEGPLNFTTYMSLSCVNCPEVVQSLNIMAVINPRITHVAVEGGAFADEVEAHGIKSVPAVFLNGEEFGSGRMGIADIVGKVDGGAAARAAEQFRDLNPFDVVVAGGGPAGVAAAVYVARKGLSVGLVAQRVGGQVLDTMAIENIIAEPHTEGPKLGQKLRESAVQAGVTILEPLTVTGLSPRGDDGLVPVHCEGDITVRGRAVIVATGAQYRHLGVPGEDEYLTKGVTFCPHCDGPLFAGEDVAVIGGGNSGIEAAIDLAHIVRHVTVVEFLPECRADKVLLATATGMDNIDIITGAAVAEIRGDGGAVTGLDYTDRATGETTTLNLRGVFVQIGLDPRTGWATDTGLELNPRGEIVTDARGATALEGIFAAGDCSTTPYKQIVTALGSGATAALSAYEYLALGR